MANVTTTLASESKRPSLSQDMLALYASLHAGGAYDAKTQIVTDGSRNRLTNGLQEERISFKGFKTNMREQQSEMRMVVEGVETTRMLTSVYGHHSTVRYGSKMGR